MIPSVMMMSPYYPNTTRATTTTTTTTENNLPTQRRYLSNSNWKGGEKESSSSKPMPERILKPTGLQLWRLFIVSAVPFIGFGFADNFIMIVAGDAIDNSIGLKMGLSTLAAAGIGNLISDVCGIGLGEVIDRRLNPC